MNMAGYFVEGFQPDSARALIVWASDDFDAYDPWGWVTSWLFDLCGEIERRGEDAPPECGYRASAFGPEVSEDRAEGLAEFPTSALYRAAQILNRYDNRCRTAMLNY